MNKNELKDLMILLEFLDEEKIQEMEKLRRWTDDAWDMSDDLGNAILKEKKHRWESLGCDIYQHILFNRE